MATTLASAAPVGAKAGAKAGAEAETIAAQRFPAIQFPGEHVTPDTLGLIVNDADPLSVQTAAYYARARGIPEENVVHLSFPAGASDLDPRRFAQLKSQIDSVLPHRVRGLALAWMRPFRVGCMSVTSAFALGFDSAYCGSGCTRTKPSPYFEAGTSREQPSLIRPAMLLAAPRFDQVRALIDRGIRSDEKWPTGKAYLLDTSDRARNVRARGYDQIEGVLGAAYPVAIVHAEALENVQDVMFYFTGSSRVARLDTLQFEDGSIADHLTSLGGVLDGGSQMSSMEWLLAGATGSFGAVVEPCNFPGKFPVPGIVMSAYLTGDTLLEAYWKSVEMPGQGLFLGEPLARPFGGARLTWSGPDLVVATHSLGPGSYLLQEAISPGELFRTLDQLRVARYQLFEFTIRNANPRRVYRLVPAVLP